MSLLLGVLGALVILTVLTVAVTAVDLGSQGNFIVAMIIATVFATTCGETVDGREAEGYQG